MPEHQVQNPVKGQRQVDFAEAGVHTATIYNGDHLYATMAPIQGPAVIEDAGATIVVCPGMSASVDQYGNVVIDTESSQVANAADLNMQITYEIIQSSLEASAMEMFQALRRTAMSPVISEALDCSTGITDANGDLACSGMGIPLFIGGLGKAVKQVIYNFSQKPKDQQIEEGDVIFLNDPYSGGITHLNDHLVLMPLYVDGELMAWSCCIAHWGDLGGMNPGSCGPNATELYHEGLIIPGVKLFKKGVVC